MTQKRYEISDEQWNQIKNLFPVAKTGRPPKDNRIMFNAILWIARSGAAWRDLPERFGSWKTVYSRFCKWRDDGTLVVIFKELTSEADYENLSIDSTCIKAHQHSAGAKKGAVNNETKQHIGLSHGGHTTKIHAVVDALGNPVYFQLSSGNLHDSTQTIDILSNIDIQSSNILADKAYGTNEIREYITSQGASYTIPPKSNSKNPWPCDWWIYKERHLVECFFNKVKHFRRIATRYDMLSSSFLAFVYISAIFVLSK
ncbi:IS5 family transposase [Clostridium sp. Marseille-Q2269]|uniref:IS5 family transposase n=1 Tax=Clostridium sp. Marseille-Q2269 TaxID=2942205 RepID=UPI002073C10F|nr:IS5 family transposase [Clostridium sp. Marseille-Q2269]